ncbi:hypothetical protein NLG97_g9950 [Lecanicillium saksenae]|uniref:Uncharacterized protein n=1 Tax=Lecanicillium saksenae TaxID=468837 RepID=A0ACC1QGE9_9HYPO|nr:hypothetical protein NLG97_g9950 [Lecanicillium saksenae]
MPTPRYDSPRVISHVPLPNLPAARRASQVPLPSYAQPASSQGIAGGKLMSLNSTIMAAQREWEQKAQQGGKFGSSSHSESGASTVSDDSGSELEELTTMRLSMQSQTAKKRKLEVEPAETSHARQKRVFSTSWRKSSGSSSSSSSSPASQLRAPAHSQRPGGNQRKPSEIRETDWLTYTSLDSITARADGIVYESFHAGKDQIVTFDNSRALGGHFSAAHKGTAYNDNCDGTFTKVGVYRKVLGERWRAIVVSRVSVNGTEEEDAFVESDPESFTEGDIALTYPDPFTYVTSFLPRHIDYSRFLSQAYIRELCELPKRRHLPESWVQFHRDKDLSERMFALAVAYITGREVFGADECDGGLHETAGRLSRFSVIIPFELSDKHRKVYFPDKSCVGCYYSSEVNGRYNRCSWAARAEPFLHRYRNRVDGLGNTDGSHRAPTQGRVAESVAQQRRNALAVDAAIKAGKASRLKMPTSHSLPQLSPPIVPDTRPYSATTIANQPEHAQISPQGNGFVYSQSFTRNNWTQRTQVAGPSQAPATGRISRSATALRNQAQDQSISPGPPTQASYPSHQHSSQLQMEDWEMAPGRMVDSTHGENIGYSNAYLNGREPVTVSEDVAFNVVTIKPGDKERWEVHESQLRTCSVAAGKIEVKIGSNKFDAGPNSMFIIRPGETCVVTNKLYGDATIHCTTIKNYSLLS